MVLEWHEDEKMMSWVNYNFNIFTQLDFVFSVISKKWSDYLVLIETEL